MLKDIGDTVRIVARPKAGFAIGLNGGIAGKIRGLFQIADRGGGMTEDLAGLRLDQTGRDLHQRGFAGAVAPHKADAVARFHLKAGTGQKRRTTEAEMNVVEFQNRGGHDQAPVKS